MLQPEIEPRLRPAPDVRPLLDPFQVRRYRAIPLRRDSGMLVIAMTDPSNLAAVTEIEFLTGARLRPVRASEAEIHRAIREHYSSSHHLPIVSRSGEATPRHPPGVTLQKSLFREAMRLGASDIHIDATNRSCRIRYRIDGVMVDGFELPRWLHDRLVARIKVIAGLDISERRIPQDGHLADVEDGFEARVSTLPAYAGEAVVLRLFHDYEGLPMLEGLGCPVPAQAQLRAMSSRSQGVLLVTGPTGSGKTTTLYALINELHRRPINIVTIEDPVEYRVGELRQVQVDERSDLTFHRALRSTLRQDPDVILVGEIRDAETARIAFHAGLTGHLVLSTVHATDSVAALVRLAELGVDRGVARSTLVGVVAQRLVRRNCTHCSEPDRPPSHLVERMGFPTGSGSSFRRSPGCRECGYSGSMGRAPLFEILEVTGTLGAEIADGRERELRTSAARAGFVSIGAQAVQCVLAGEVSVEEAYRTCDFGGLE